ncbi:hypothetical protein FHR32_008167 [Streptosporangium album]|uniref:Uncharacterized protein n=1 Tax=Streptosporangium album TaxID=47479 RepID=A0A7W7S6G7_9ACTN|nr:hypothetical protein [Streptosporangium album]
MIAMFSAAARVGWTFIPRLCASRTSCFIWAFVPRCGSIPVKSVIQIAVLPRPFASGEEWPDHRGPPLSYFGGVARKLLIGHDLCNPLLQLSEL